MGIEIAKKRIREEIELLERANKSDEEYMKTKCPAYKMSIHQENNYHRENIRSGLLKALSILEEECPEESKKGNLIEISFENMKRVDTCGVITYMMEVQKEPSVRLYIQEMPEFYKGFDVYMRVLIGDFETEISIVKNVRTIEEAIGWAEMVIEILMKGSDYGRYGNAKRE